MRILITALVVLVVSVLLTLAVKQDNGYILLGYGAWTVEGSLAFFILLNLLLFLLLYITIRFLLRLWAVPARVHDWQDRRSSQRARKFLTQGLLELSEGKWREAEKDLVRFAGRSETPLLNYLAAARSAQQQGAHERRDQYLQLAHESMPMADVAVGLTQAELQLAHDQYEQALATLKHLRSIAPKHIHVLKLLKELYQRLGEWEALQDLLPELKKRKVIDSDERGLIEFSIHRNVLDRAAQDEDVQQLMGKWRSIPAAIRADERMLVAYINHLLNHGERNTAEYLLRERIAKEWSVDLVELYGRVEAGDESKMLATAEGWLKGNEKDPILLLTLGRLAIRNKLWGKARSYLEASIALEPSVDAYRELGALLERLEETQQALGCFRAGLELTSSTPLSPLPPVLTQQTKVRLEQAGERVETPVDAVAPERLEFNRD